MLPHPHAHSYSTLEPPKKPISLRSSLSASLQDCVVVRFSESELAKL